MFFQRVGKPVFVVFLALPLLAMGSGAQSQPPQVIRVPDPQQGFLSIQKAIDMIAEGGTILIAPGLWDENLVIQKSLTLRGEGKEPKEVRIVGVKSGYPVIHIESEQEITVAVENLAVTEAKGDACQRPAICPDGVVVRGKAKVTIADFLVFHNRHGLFVSSEHSDDAVQVSVRDSRIFSNSGQGLSVRGPAHVNLAKLTVTDNREGVYIDGPARVNFSQCDIAGNRGTGLIIRGAASVTVGRSHVRENGFIGGFFVSGSGEVRLFDSDVWLNRGHALRVEGSFKARLVNSQIYSNSDGLWVMESASLEIRGSAISNNAGAGISLLQKAVADI